MLLGQEGDVVGCVLDLGRSFVRRIGQHRQVARGTRADEHGAPRSDAEQQRLHWLLVFDVVFVELEYHGGGMGVLLAYESVDCVCKGLET